MIFRAIVLLVISFGLQLSTLAQNTVPTAMAYQGRLTDANGNAAADGTGYEIDIRLWTTATGGTQPIWAARYSNIPVKNGAFNLILGGPGGGTLDGAIPDLKTVFNTTPTTYLSLTVTKNASGTAVASPTEILPRQQLFSSPYAFRAEVAGTANAVGPNVIVSESIKDGEVKTSDIANNSVTLDKIADANITGLKVAIDSIPPDRIIQEFAIFADEVPAGTNRPSIAGWQTRPLTQTYASSGSSISRNGSIITLQPGVYCINGTATSSNTHFHQLILRDRSNESAEIRGTMSASDDSYNGSSNSIIIGYLRVEGLAKNYDLYHFTKIASPRGLGWSTSFTAGQRNEPSVFALISIQKMK